MAKIQKYFYFGLDYHMVQSDSNYLEVTVYGKEYGVAKKSNPDMVDLLIEKGREITREKFMEVFLKALSHINHAYFMEVLGLATDEYIREHDYIDETLPLNEDQLNELFERNEGISEPVNTFI